MTTDRELYILSLHKKVLVIARSLCARLPSTSAIHIDDMIQAGWLGAIAAVDGHDPSRGILENYANWRIRGAILDYMRDCDFLKKEHRQEVKRTGEEAPKNVSIDGLLDGGQYSFDLPDKNALRLFGSINASIDCLAILRRSGLLERQRKVLLGIYWDQKTLKEIGETEAVHGSETRVSQLHKAAIAKCHAVI